MRELTILTMFPNAIDITSWYRGARVFGQLRRKHQLSYVQCSGAVDWPTVAQCDLVFMQRPFNQQHVSMMNVAHALGIPVWIDYDDDLLSVPQSNGAWLSYANPEIRESIKFLQENADHISVTTNYLAQKMNSKKVTVIPNAYDNVVMNRLPQHEMQYKKVVLWRGTDTHFDDVMALSTQIKQLAEEHSDEWTWYFAGWNPYFLTRVMPEGKAKYMPFQPIFHYVHWLQNLAPQIMMVPLLDSPFNRSKSNCAWLEGTFGGAAIVAPKWEEWDKPGVHAYTDNDDFYTKMNRLMNGWSKSYSEISYSHIKKNLMLTDVNEMRLDIIRKLCGVK